MYDRHTRMVRNERIKAMAGICSGLSIATFSGVVLATLVPLALGTGTGAPGLTHVLLGAGVLIVSLLSVAIALLGSLENVD